MPVEKKKRRKSDKTIIDRKHNFKPTSSRAEVAPGKIKTYIEVWQWQI